MASSRPERGSSGPSKRRRLDAPDEQSRTRVECILREQLDLELYLKQKEINAISTRLHHSEALLAVLESAIRAQSHVGLSPDDAADGLMGHFCQLRVATAAEHELVDRRQLGRPRRAAVAAASARCMARDYEAMPGSDTGSDDARSAPVSEGRSRSSRRRTPARTPRLGVLSSRLDAEQMSSVTDALEFIRTRREPGVESSAPSSGDESWDDAADTAHAQRPGGLMKGTSILVQPSRESRFHVLRRVLLGNTSQFVAPQDRPPGMENSTHMWTVYLRGVSADDAPGDYIRKVRVFLHPSYRPDDIVDLEPPYLELTRRGWGEFPVRIQVFFLDRRNKPVDLIHMLKLDDRGVGNEAVGAETPVDFELDRRWFAGDNSAAATATRAPSRLEAVNPILRELFRLLCSLYPLVLDDAIPPGARQPGNREAALDKLPNATLDRWTWGVAASADVWHMSWPLGRRLASENSRNIALLCLLSAASKELRDAEGDPAHGPSKADARCFVEHMAASVLRLAAADEQAADATRGAIRSSDDAACTEAKAMLLNWAAEFRADRPLRPDRGRAGQLAQHEPSLRRWLRSYGYVPLPMLSAGEQLDGLPGPASDASGGHMAMSVQRADVASSIADQGSAKAAPNTSRWGSGLTSSEFCHSCGVVVPRVPNESIPAGPTAAGGHAACTSRIIYCGARCESASRSGLATTATPVGEALSALPSGWDVPDDDSNGDMDIVVAVDNDSTPCPASSSTAEDAPPCPCGRIDGVASSLREYYLDERWQRGAGLGHSGAPVGQDGCSGSKSARIGEEASADEAIDWIWSTVRPLELNCATAARLAITDSDSSGTAPRSGSPGCLIRLPNGSNEAFEEALDQRLIVGRLLLDTAKLFLRDLIAASDKALRANRATCVDGASDAARTSAGGGLLMLTPLHVLAAVKQNTQAFDVCSNAHLGRDDGGGGG